MGLRILVDGQIRVTPPGEFNDPMEFSPGVFERTHTTQEWRTHFENPRSFGHKMAEHLFHSSGGAFRSLDETIETIIGRPNIASQHIQWCHECIRQWFCTYFGAACFSAISPFCEDAVRHWAFYGAAHTGLAIVFNSQTEFFRKWAQLRLLFSVDYRPERPPCTLRDFDERSTEQCLRLLRRWGGVKSKVWKPEKEWRLIRFLTDEPPLLPIHRQVDGDTIVYLHKLWNSPEEAKEMISQVVVGCRASSALENSARAACAHMGLSPDTVVRAQEDPSEFRLIEN